PRSASPFEHQIERTLASVAAMRAADRGDVARVRAGGEPVEHLGADRAAMRRAIGRRRGPRLAGDQQHQPRAHRPGLHQALVEPLVGLLERVAVEVEGEVGLDRGARELALPRGVEAGAGRGTRRRLGRRGWWYPPFGSALYR